MADVTVITNNVPRNYVDASDLPEDQRKNFDYIDWSEPFDTDVQFVQYKGEWYDLNDMEVHRFPPDWIKGWDAYVSETFFSGILVKWVNDYEQVIMGRYYC